MAKIKNKDEFVKRTRWHAAHDHIAQGTYGDGRANGEVEFQGCFIGCAAAPHRKRDLRRYVKTFFTNGGIDLDSDSLVYRLRDEFGIEPILSRTAEAIFESLPKHGAAINFIPEFAEALPEGKNVSKRQIEKVLKGVGLYYSYHDDGDPQVSWPKHSEIIEAEDVRDALLSYLRGRA